MDPKTPSEENKAIIQSNSNDVEITPINYSADSPRLRNGSYQSLGQAEASENENIIQEDLVYQDKKEKTFFYKTMRIMNVPQNKSVLNNILGYTIWLIIMNFLFWESTQVCKGVQIDNMMSCIRDLKQVLLTIFEILSSGFIFFYLALQIFKDAFKISRVFVGLFLIFNLWLYKILCKGFNMIDHSQANMFFFIFVVALLAFFYLFYLTFVFTNYIDGKYFKVRTKNNSSNGAKALNFVKRRRCFLSYVTTLITLLSYWIIYKVSRSCDFVNQSLLSINGMEEDTKECKYKKLSICWHQLIMDWDSILYDNSLTCKDPYFDDMTNQIFDKLMKDTGKKIIAWPTVDIIAKKEKDSIPDKLYQFIEIQDLFYKHARTVTKQEMLEGPEEVYIDFEDNPKGKYKVNIRDKAKTDEKLALRLKSLARIASTWGAWAAQRQSK